MTHDIPTDAGTSSPRTAGQWRSVTRLLLPEAMRSLLMTTVVMLAVVLVGGAVARSLGWQVVTEVDVDRLVVELEVDRAGVTAFVSLLLVPAGVAIAGFVMAIVLAASQTRTLIAAGATRAAVAAGNLLTVVAMTLYICLLTAAVLLLTGTGPRSLPAMVGADGPADLMGVVIGGVGSVLLWLVAGVAIATMFLRWQWWVGVIVLAFASWILPLLVALLPLPEVPSVADTMEAASGWVFLHLVGAIVVAAVYVLTVRRVPVP